MLKNFGIRLLVSFVVLGIAYLLIFGWPGSHNKPTTSQRLAAVRTALDQTYIDSNSIASFNQDNSVAYATLSDMMGQFKAHTSELEAAVQAAGDKLSPTERNEIQSIIGSQKQVAASFQSQYSVVAKVVSYDPSSDLGSLNIQSQRGQLQERAVAARQGLTSAAGNSTVASATQQHLRGQAECFGKLASLLTEDAVGASTTRTSCINSYPSVRLAAIQDAIQAAFTPSYQSYMKQRVPSLLSQLDHTINH